LSVSLPCYWIQEREINADPHPNQWIKSSAPSLQCLIGPRRWRALCRRPDACFCLYQGTLFDFFTQCDYLARCDCLHSADRCSHQLGPILFYSTQQHVHKNTCDTCFLQSNRAMGQFKISYVFVCADSLMYTAHSRDPDLLVRTSGKMILSDPFVFPIKIRFYQLLEFEL
jgi:hypothetical protein